MPNLPQRLVRRHRLVLSDIVNIADYIARDSVDAALRYVENTETSVAGLLEMPGKGAPCGFIERHLADVRFWAVNGFPNHLIFYRPTAYGIYVLSVRHGARELPGDLPGRGPEEP